VKVYLSTEGTYPFVVGGVSTWADLLVRGLDDHEFHVAAVVDNPIHPLSFTPPANVTLQAIPLWGSEMIDEYLAVPGSWKRALRTSSKEVRKRFLPCWEPFVDVLAAHEAPTAALADNLAEVARFAERYDLRRALASPATWSVLLESLRGNPLMARSPCNEAIEFGRALFRFLIPLCAPIPRCDIAHTSAAGLCALPAVVAKYRYGTPLLLTEHGIYLRERLMASAPKPIEEKFLMVNFFRAVTELTYREADMLAPVCAYNARWEQDLGVQAERIKVIHNGLTREPLAVLKPSPPAGTPPTVGFVGRLDVLKDVVTLIRAFAIVRSLVPDARLRLWGPASTPEYLERCQTVASSLGLGPGVVSFEGRTSDLPGAYGSCHVIALSSITEGFPYTVVEAMLAARPVVATDVGGVAEALGGIGFSCAPGSQRAGQMAGPPGTEDGIELTDLLVEPGEPQALARALVNALTAPEERRLATGLALRHRALEQFNVGRFLAGYRHAYAELAGTVREMAA
jgi:glycosyltransferase involved in cell wall biosynthesis